MTDVVRVLNDEGVRRFAAFVDQLRIDPKTPVPFSLLNDPATSEPAEFAATIVRNPHGKIFESAYDLGEYLNEIVLAGIPKARLSRNYRLWNWLSLYFFDQLCPDQNGERSPKETAAYVLGKQMIYTRYYRHFVRSAWLAVNRHGRYAKVLLKPISANALAPAAVRTDIPMQLSATQAFVESHSVVRAAYLLYYDEVADKVKKGAGGSGGGSPRRLVSILNQLDRTYDLHAAAAETIVELLPKEFERFRRPAMESWAKGDKAATPPAAGKVV